MREKCAGRGMEMFDMFNVIKIIQKGMSKKLFFSPSFDTFHSAFLFCQSISQNAWQNVIDDESSTLISFSVKAII